MARCEFRHRLRHRPHDHPMNMAEGLVMQENTTNLRVVVVGGGTGIYAVLTGLRSFTPHITAVVSMSDNGGSSGRLRDEFGFLPPGDVRRCLVALAAADDSM